MNIIYFIILFVSIISLVVIIKDNYEYIKTQVPEYKPNLISYYKGLDWNNYLIEEKWIEIIETEIKKPKNSLLTILRQLIN